MARAGASKSLDKPTPKARGASETVKPAPVKAAMKAAAKAVRKKTEPAAVTPKPKVRARKAVTPPAKAAKTAKPSPRAGKAVKAPPAPAVNVKTKAAPAAKAPSTRKTNSEVAVAEAPKAKRAGTATKAPAKAAAVVTPAKAPEGAGFPAKTLDKLRRLLEEERGTYLRQARDLAAEAEALAAEREPGDTQFDEESGEGDTLNVERERDLALSASATQAVEDIDRALRRMDAGTFGICERCGKKITVARLEALPFAALCIECKSREERRR